MDVSRLSTYLSRAYPLPVQHRESLPTSIVCSELWITLKRTDVQVLMSCLWEMGLMSG